MILFNFYSQPSKRLSRAVVYLNGKIIDHVIGVDEEKGLVYTFTGAELRDPSAKTGVVFNPCNAIEINEYGDFEIVRHEGEVRVEFV